MLKKIAISGNDAKSEAQMIEISLLFIFEYVIKK